jgi:hypothetical protein
MTGHRKPVAQVETSLGRVPLWGDFQSDRRLVLGIRGAVPAPDQLADLDPPDCDLALLHLPGFFSPSLQAISIGVFVAAFDEMIRLTFPGRDITAVGISTGALVALGLRSPEVHRVLAVEPFFSTAKLWPLREHLTALLAQQQQPLLHKWVDAIFGYRLDGVTDRDYRTLAIPPRPILSLVGDVPLQPFRPIYGLPSLSDEEDRARFKCKVVPGGHDIPVDEIRRALVDLHNQDEQPASGARARDVSSASPAAANCRSR